MESQIPSEAVGSRVRARSLRWAWRPIRTTAYRKKCVNDCGGGNNISSDGNGTTVSADLAATNVTPSGFFALHTLSPGTYTVTPLAQDAVFRLSNQVVNVGFDSVNADFLHTVRTHGMWSG